jgi:hypothetical protein
MRPVMTPPRGIEKSTFSNTWASASSMGRPGSNGRRWPYCMLTKPAFDANS